MVSDGGAHEKARRRPDATPAGPPASSPPMSGAAARPLPEPGSATLGRPTPGPDQLAGVEGADRHGEASLRPQILALLPDLRAFARFLARDRTLADDLVQETLVRALGALGQFQPGTNLKAWLFTIQRNAFFEHTRRRRREDMAVREHFADGEAESPAQHSAADLSDLQRMLFSLPPLLREALVLVGAQELSHEVAAAICGVPVGTMKARVSRARSKLAQITGRGAGQEPDA